MNKILATGLLGLALVSAIPAVAADSKADKTWQEAWTAYNIGQYKKTLRLLQPLASDGDARSQVLLGRCYENGLGVPQDLATAFKWYMLAAEQNDAEAHRPWWPICCVPVRACRATPMAICSGCSVRPRAVMPRPSSTWR